MQATQGGSYVAYVGAASTPGYTAFTAGAGSLGAMPGLLGGGTFAGANLSLAAKIMVALGGGAIIGHQMMAAMGGGGRPRPPLYGEGHAIERHGPNRDQARWGRKSQFDSEALARQAIKQADPIPGVQQQNGNWAITFNMGRDIGFDRNTNSRTSIVTVIAKPDGCVITAFPGTP
jgi:hypothetical protein